jgi:hypothetical protein
MDGIKCFVSPGGGDRCGLCLRGEAQLVQLSAPALPVWHHRDHSQTCIWSEGVESRSSAFRDLFPLLQEVLPQS